MGWHRHNSLWQHMGQGNIGGVRPNKIQRDRMDKHDHVRQGGWPGVTD